MASNSTGRGADGIGESFLNQHFYDYDFPRLTMGDGQTAAETLAKLSNGPWFTGAFVFLDSGGHTHMRSSYMTLKNNSLQHANECL